MGLLRELKIGVTFAMNGMGQLWKTNSDLDKLKGSALGSGQALDTLKGKADRAGAALSYTFKQAKTAIGGALDVLNQYKMELGLMAAMGAAVIASSVGAAGDANEQLNAFQQTFVNTWKTQIVWAEKFGDSVQRSKWNVMDWAAQFGAVFTSMGVGEEQAAEYSKQMVKLGVDLGSLWNKKPQDAVERLTSALVGNYEATRELHIIMTEDDVKAYARRKGIIATNRELTSSEKLMARMGLMMERGAVANDDATRTAFSYNNQLVAFQENTKDLSITFGEQFLPVFNQAIIGTNKFLSTLKSANMKNIAWAVGLATAMFGIAAGLGAIKAALPFLRAFLFDPKMLITAGAIVAIALVVEDLWTALNGGKSVLSPLVNWFKKYGEVIKWVGTAIGVFFAPAIIMQIVGGIMTFAKAIGFIGWAIKFQWLTSIWPAISSVGIFSAALWACPITWIVAGVIALGVGIYLLWKNWDKVNAAIKKTPDWIIGIIGVFNPLIGSILFVIKHFQQLKQIWNDITSGNWGKAGFDTKNLFGGIGNEIFGKGPKQLKADPVFDQKAADQLTNATVNKNQTKVNQNNIGNIQINVTGNKNPKETGKQVRKELGSLFDEQSTSTVGGF